MSTCHWIHIIPYIYSALFPLELHLERTMCQWRKQKWIKFIWIANETTSHKHTHIAPHRSTMNAFRLSFLHGIIYKANSFQPYLAVKKNVLPHSLDLSATPIQMDRPLEWRCCGVRSASNRTAQVRKIIFHMRCDTIPMYLRLFRMSILSLCHHSFSRFFFSDK